MAVMNRGGFNPEEVQWWDGEGNPSPDRPVEVAPAPEVDPSTQGHGSPDYSTENTPVVPDAPGPAIEAPPNDDSASPEEK